MKNYATFLCFIAFPLVLTSCGGSSGPSSQGATSKVELSFSDTAVSNFNQLSGVAKLSPLQQSLELILASAFAGGGNISCLTGTDISLQMDALGNTVSIDTTCTSASGIETAIRAGLLESFDGLILEPTVSEAQYGPTGGRGTDGFGKLDFSGTGKAFGFYSGTIDNSGISPTASADSNLHSKIYTVKAKDDCDGAGNHQYDVFIFKSDGTVYNYVLLKGALATALGVGGSIADQATHQAQCYADGVTDANSDGLVDKSLDQAKIAFRFKDGALEMDFSGQGVFAESHGEDNGSTCSNATIPNSNSCESAFEKWEEAD